MKQTFVCWSSRSAANGPRAFSVAPCGAITRVGGAPVARRPCVPQALNDGHPIERDIGRSVGLAWLAVADELLVAGPISDGMRHEIAAAAGLGLPIRFRERGR